MFLQQLQSHLRHSRLRWQHRDSSSNFNSRRRRQLSRSSSHRRRLRAQVCHHRMVSAEMNFIFATYDNSHANLSHYILLLLSWLRPPNKKKNKNLVRNCKLLKTSIVICKRKSTVLIIKTYCKDIDKLTRIQQQALESVPENVCIRLTKAKHSFVVYVSCIV